MVAPPSGNAPKMGLADRCHFVGRRVSDLKSYYQLMDALLLTSDCEGLPNSLIEAQALGIPVVARSTGGVAEAVDHEVTGLVVHSRQPRELARAVERILRDVAFRERVRSSGPAFIRALTGMQADPVWPGKCTSTPGISALRF